MKDITSRIDMQISSQIAKLRHQQSTLQKDSDIVEQKIGDVLNKIELSVKSELIRSFPELLQELLGMSVQLAKPPTANLTYLGKELEFTNELVPPYLDREFVIEGFFSCRRRGTPIYSPPLYLHGQVWKLKLRISGYSLSFRPIIYINSVTGVSRWQRSFQRRLLVRVSGAEPGISWLFQVRVSRVHGARVSKLGAYGVQRVLLRL